MAYWDWIVFFRWQQPFDIWNEIQQIIRSCLKNNNIIKLIIISKIKQEKLILTNKRIKANKL